MTTNRKLTCCVTIIAALAASILVFAKPKDKEKDKDNDSEVKFTARSELVLIPTLVTDKTGNHILGLKQGRLHSTGERRRTESCHIRGDHQRRAPSVAFEEFQSQRVQQFRCGRTLRQANYDHRARLQ